MKKTISWILLCVVFACNTANNTDATSSSGTESSQGYDMFSITIKGSDTVKPISEEEKDRFLERHPDANIQVVGGGSGVGIAALINSTTDIAMVSRDLNYQEKNSLALLGRTTERVVIAYDALAVIVHPSNPVGALTIKQIEQIYTGRINNWNQISDANGQAGPDLAIAPTSRETSSGTYGYFQEVAMHSRAYAPNVLKMPSTQAVVSYVAETPGAVGYIGLAYIDESVKPISVYNPYTEEFIEPLPQYARDNTYPIVRPLYYFFLQEDTQRLKPIIDFVLSSDGQDVIEEVGYVPL